MAEVEAEELAEANAKADLKAHSETEAYEAELSGSESEPEPVQSEAAPEAEAVSEPTKYWIGCYGGRNMLNAVQRANSKKAGLTSN